tara:strand:+ start:30 stop:488 length:459 start_codon:yes stop_codon:yes gene_type:complete
MEVKTKITYNAAKLAKALPKMMENFIEGSGESTIEASRKRIDSINYISHNKVHPKMPNLSDRTIALRKANKLEKKSYGRPVAGNIPLKYTGNFYNSMKATKKGVEMSKYGWYHNEGKDSGGIMRPKREFFEFKQSEKAEKRFESDLNKNFRK